MDDDAPKLGPCCNCGKTDDVRNIVMVSRRGPSPGYGWGCAVCGLPCDGAVAVLCDDCIGMTPAFVCDGYPYIGKRFPYADLPPEDFDHDKSKHQEELDGSEVP